MIPNTAPWRKVVGLIAGDADVATVAGATSVAARQGLELAGNDNGLRHTFWLLTQVTLAARSDNFADSLRYCGVDVPLMPSVLDIAVGLNCAVDRHLLETRGRTDIGEMAQLAGAECLTAIRNDRAGSLFGTTAAEVQRAVRSCSTKAGFSSLAYDFFSRFTQRYLNYHLSRELPNHVGPEQRFVTPSEHTEFVGQLRAHCREVALIVRVFAGDWYSKANYEGGISPRKASGFVSAALNKIRAELQIRGA